MSDMSRAQRIHQAAMEIIREVGVTFHNDEACRILKENGIRVEGHVAYFTEEQVMHWVHMAPAQFTLYGRSEQYRLTLGDGSTNPAPTYGCAFIAERDGTQRPGTMADYVKALKLVHASEIYQLNGGILIQPGDIPDTLAPLAMFYAAVTHSDKALLLPTADKAVMEAMLQAACHLFGGREALAEKPRMIALINTNSPLALDGKMLDNLMLMARYGQPVIVCPAAMLGATGPLFMAGTVAMGAAESLAGIVLAQMIRPGTPCVFGIQSTAVDMHGLTFACAAPEGTLMQGFSADLGRFYHLPSRGGGSQCDAPFVNAQAGYESMLTYYAAVQHGISLVMEAGGVVASVNATSFDKMIVDFEIIRQVQFASQPFAVDADTLCLDEIKAVGHGGSFVTTDTTLDNFMELYMPRIGSRDAKSPSYFEDSIDRECKRLMDVYEDSRPALDPAVRDAVRAVCAEAGLTVQQMDEIEAL